MIQTWIPTVRTRGIMISAAAAFCVQLNRKGNGSV